jgi:hypothetical protein
MSTKDLSEDQFAETIRPRCRGKSQTTIAMVNAARVILEEIQPATVRAVCYRLFTTGLIDAMTKTNTNKVSRALVSAREQGIIPWEWIVDETREVEQVPSWNNPDSLIRAAVAQYRKDYWYHQPNHVEVFSEKGTVRGTLKPLLDEFGVAFRVMHGYGSATAIKGIAEVSAANSKPFIALYVGDWDCSGLHMSEIDLPQRIAQYGGNVHVVRLALSRNDVERGQLPSFDADTKRGDPRYRWFVRQYGSTCWELDALSPVVLRNRVRAGIIQRLDIRAWNRMVDVEAAERESMSDVLGQWSRLMQAQNCSGGRA